MAFLEGDPGANTHEFSAFRPPAADMRPFEETFPAIDTIKASRLLYNPYFIAIASLRKLAPERQGYMPMGLQDLFNDAAAPALDALTRQLEEKGFTTGEVWSCLAVVQGKVDFPIVCEDVLASDPSIQDFIDQIYEQDVFGKIEEEEAEAEKPITEILTVRSAEEILAMERKALRERPPTHFHAVKTIIDRIREIHKPPKDPQS